MKNKLFAKKTKLKEANLNENSNLLEILHQVLYYKPHSEKSWWSQQCFRKVQGNQQQYEDHK